MSELNTKSNIQYKSIKSIIFKILLKYTKVLKYYFTDMLFILSESN